ncbi:adenosine receptor A1-like, partial [Halichoeres trimaculatus]|uniref:adenosine receptor A1-like n=1 Tax=Halichoeres trimaculatus TaxID=147232 RepID=UPI003D9EA94D
IIIIIIIIILEVLIAVCCCFGNMSVIVALWISKCFKQPTFCLIASLAVADFMVGCVTIPLALVVEGQRMKTSFDSCLFFSCVVILFTVVSTLSLVVIAVDRFLRVYIPLRYKTSLIHRHTRLVVAACWLVAVPLSFTPMLGWHNPKPPPNTDNSSSFCDFMVVIPMSYLVYFNCFVCTVIPLLIMAVLYGYIFCTFRVNLREKPGCGAHRQSQSDLKKEKELAGSLSLVVALYALTWLPLQIMNCIDYFIGSSVVPLPAVCIGVFLTHANSAVNPIVYAFKIQKIRSAYVKIWRRFTERRGENRGLQTNQTNQTSRINLSSNINSVTKTE